MANNFSNIAVATQLDGAINDLVVTLDVLDSTGYPSVPFNIEIGTEVINVGAHTASTFSSLTRGHDGTTAASHGNGDNVNHRVTAEDMRALLLAGGAMTGDIDMSANNILGASDFVAESGGSMRWIDDNAKSRFLILPNATGDLIFSDASGSSTLIWDESKSVWKFVINYVEAVGFSGTSINIRTIDASTQARIHFLNSADAIKGSVGWVSPDLALELNVSSDATGVGFKDRTGIRLRVYDGGNSTGDISFYKADNSTVSLLWDESDDRWELESLSVSSTVDMNLGTIDNVGTLYFATTGLDYKFYSGTDDLYIQYGTFNRIGIFNIGWFRFYDDAGAIALEYNKTNWAFKDPILVGTVDSPLIDLDRTSQAGGVAEIRFETNNVGMGRLGLGDLTSESMYLSAFDGNLYLQARKTTAAAADIDLYTDDSGGVARLRFRADGNGNTLLYDNAGVNRLYVDTFGAIITGRLGGVDDPTTGSHVGDMDFNDARYLELAGGSMTGNLVMATGSDLITGAAADSLNLYGGAGATGARIELFSGTHASLSDDMYFSADQHVFRGASGIPTFMSLQSTGMNLQGNNMQGLVQLLGTTNNHVYLQPSPGYEAQIRDKNGKMRIRVMDIGDIIFTDTSEVATFWWDQSTSAWKMEVTFDLQGNQFWDVGNVTAVNRDLSLRSVGTATNGIINMWADDSAGTARLRQQIHGTGDIQFRKVDGTTISLLWDETDDRWEFASVPWRSGTAALTTSQMRNVYVGTSAPGTPQTGDLWLDTT